jgi:LPXTG-motif cell wall-anchored protein
MPNDTTKSDWELLEEYPRIVTLTERSELAFRVRRWGKSLIAPLSRRSHVWAIGDSMDTTTLLVIIIVFLLLGGGGWYGRRRWF